MSSSVQVQNLAKIGWIQIRRRFITNIIQTFWVRSNICVQGTRQYIDLAEVIKHMASTSEMTLQEMTAIGTGLDMKNIQHTKKMLIDFVDEGVLEKTRNGL